MFEAYESIFSRRGQAYHRAMQLVPGARRALEQVGLRRGDVICDVPSVAAQALGFALGSRSPMVVATDDGGARRRYLPAKREGPGNCRPPDGPPASPRLFNDQNADGKLRTLREVHSHDDRLGHVWTIGRLRDIRSHGDDRTAGEHNVDREAAPRFDLRGADGRHQGSAIERRREAINRRQPRTADMALSAHATLAPKSGREQTEAVMGQAVLNVSGARPLSQDSPALAPGTMR